MFAVLAQIPVLEGVGLRGAARVGFGPVRFGIERAGIRGVGRGDRDRRGRLVGWRRNGGRGGGGRGLTGKERDKGAAHEGASHGIWSTMARVRLPLRHAPPAEDAAVLRCAHLEVLAQAATGLPLASAAALLTAARSRGRHGNALQWHFGLEPHDGSATLDWEDRIEIKLVTLWRNARGDVTSDKLKVGELSIDPWRKLANVLFVFADRVSRVVVGHRFWRLAGAAREGLARAWEMDPHFGEPDLFVEAREQGDRSAPAYYVSARWLGQQGLRPDLPGVLGFDSKVWSRLRSEGRDPLVTLGDDASVGRCPRCGGRVHFDPKVLSGTGWAAAIHAMPLHGPCAVQGHVVVGADRLPPISGPFSQMEQFAAVHGLGPVFRLSDRVLEPKDHLH